MEEAQLRFGALNSADVKLWLTGPNDEKYKRNPVYVHSEILKRSEFLQAMMSERWSSFASELLSNELMNKCMQYLQGVHWSAAEETRIGEVLSCLGLKPSPDLAARLDK
ncbi:hypothetical protein SUGI_1012980 [Cryptomeria japonica]|nr:hypothetical protein SUGI_1012980 [Cryptomeria japonica]